MASSARKIVIEFLGDDKSASRTAKSVEGSTSRMGDKMQKAGKVAGTVLAAGLGLAAVGAYKATQAAAEDEQAQVKLADVMRKAAGASDTQIASTEKWITAQGKALGVSDEELRPALGKLVAATHDVGKAQKLAALAMDVSAGRGKSLESVTEALSKAQNGNLGGLSRLGVATKDAAGNALSLNEIQKNLNDTYGGAAAKAADTAAGKQKILTVQMHELQEQIGTALLPVMGKLVEIGMKVVDWVSHNTTTVGVLIGVLGGLLAVTWAVGTAIKVWSAITKIATGVQIAFNAVMAMNPIGLVVIALIALAAGLVIAYKKSETFRKIVDGAFKGVKKVAMAVFNWLKSAVGNVIDYIKSHWKLLVAILAGPLGLAVYAVIKNWGKIKAATKAAWDWVKNITRAAWGAIRDGVRNAGEAIVGVARSIWDRVRGVFDAGADRIVDFIRGLPGRIRNLGSFFKSAGLYLIQAFVNGMKNAAGIIGGIAGNVWDVLQGLLNSAIDKINAGVEFGIHKGPVDIDINPPDIPHLARGTSNFRGGMALVGEQGPELVIMPRGSQVKTAAQTRAMAGGSGGGEYVGVVNLVLDGKIIQKSLLTLKRRNGTLDLGLA